MPNPFSPSGAINSIDWLPLEQAEVQSLLSLLHTKGNWSSLSFLALGSDYLLSSSQLRVKSQKDDSVHLRWVRLGYDSQIERKSIRHFKLVTRTPSLLRSSWPNENGDKLAYGTPNSFPLSPVFLWFFSRSCQGNSFTPERDSWTTAAEIPQRLAYALPYKEEKFHPGNHLIKSEQLRVMAYFTLSLY